MNNQRLIQLQKAAQLSVTGKPRPQRKSATLKPIIIPVPRGLPSPVRKNHTVIDDSAREAADIYIAKQRLLAERQSILKEGATLSELKVAELLDEGCVRFLFQKGFMTTPDHSSKFYIIDFYIPVLKLCLEVDGGYHKAAEAKAHDHKREVFLTQNRRFTILRISNQETEDMTCEELLHLFTTLKKRRVNYSRKYRYYIH